MRRHLRIILICNGGTQQVFCTFARRKFPNNLSHITKGVTHYGYLCWLGSVYGPGHSQYQGYGETRRRRGGGGGENGYEDRRGILDDGRLRRCGRSRCTQR